MNRGFRHRFITLRVFCAVLLILSSVFNVLAYGNFGDNITVAHAETIVIGTDYAAEALFKEKFANAPDGTVLDLNGNQSFTVRAADNENWLINNHNIKVINGTLNLRYGGIICNGDLTFEDVELNLNKTDGAVIVANGHNLTFNNVTKYENNVTDTTIFGGTVVNSAETIPAAGNWSQTTINVTGENDLGKIFMGNHDAQKDGKPLASGMADYGKTFSSCTVNIDENCTQYSKTKENRTVYASGGYMAGQNSFVATPYACPVSGGATINAYEDRILTVEAETGRNWPKATYNYNGGEYVTDNVTLHNLTSLQVKSGKFQPKTDSSFASATYRTRLGVATGAILYAGNLSDASFMYFDGGGTLNLGKSRTDTSQTLTFTDAVNGTTELEFGNTPNFKGLGVLDTNYIVASKSGADAFKVSNPATGQQGFWNRDSSGNWLFSSTKPGVHEHVYGDAYSFDENDHWYQCIDAACPDVQGSKIRLAAHEYEDDYSRKCLDCDYKRVIIDDIFFAKDDSKMELLKERVFNSLLHSQASIDVSDLNLTYNDIAYISKEGNSLTGTNACRTMVREHPFFSTLCTTGDVTFEHSGNTISKINYTLAQYTWKPETISLALEAYEEAMALITPSMDTVQKLAVLHDWVCDHITYSMGAPMADFAIGGLANGRAVCAGYAQTMQFLLDQIGIENVYVAAQTPSESHAWNLVKVDGYWFHIDTTWDDGVAGSNSFHHTFFLLNDDEFKKSGDDDGDGVGTHGTDWLDQKKYPANVDAYFANKYWSGVSGKLTDNLLSQDPKLTVKRTDCKHEHTKIETIVASTCSTKGSGKKLCEDCGETLEEDIELELNPNNHENVKDVASVPSTCKVPGKSSYKHCDACNTNITEPTELPLDPNNHEHLIDVPALDPTCQTPGYTAHQKCTSCDTEIGKTVLPTVDHKFDDTGHCIWCGKEADPDPAPSKPTVKNPVVSGDSRGRYTMTCNGVPVTAGQKLEAGSTINFTTYHVAPDRVYGNTIVILNSCTVNGVNIMNLDRYSIDTLYGQQDSNVIWNGILNNRESFSYTIPSNFTGDLNISFDFIEAQIVWRIYNPITREHVFTPYKDEYEKNRSAYFGTRWNGEGVAWISPMSGQPVYRIYNEGYDRQGLCSHFLTADKNEADFQVARNGWRYDNGGKPVYYSGGSVNIYHTFNEGENLSHHYTKDKSEYDALCFSGQFSGWAPELDRNAIQDAYGNIIGWREYLKR